MRPPPRAPLRGVLPPGHALLPQGQGAAGGPGGGAGPRLVHQVASDPQTESRSAPLPLGLPLGPGPPLLSSAGSHPHGPPASGCGRICPGGSQSAVRALTQSFFSSVALCCIVKGRPPGLPCQPPAVALQSPSVTLQPPLVTLQSPSVTLHSPSVPLQPPSVTLQPPSVTLQPPSVIIQPPPATLQHPSVSLQRPSRNLQQHPRKPSGGLNATLGTETAARSNSLRHADSRWCIPGALTRCSDHTLTPSSLVLSLRVTAGHLLHNVVLLPRSPDLNVLLVSLER